MHAIDPSQRIKSTFLNDEILINNSRYPVLLMDWVEGKQLNDFIDDIILDNDIMLMKNMIDQLVN